MFGRHWEGLTDAPLCPGLPHQSPISSLSLPLVPLVMISSLLLSALTSSSPVLNSRPVQCAQNWLQTLDELGLVVCRHVVAVAGPERVGEVGEGGEPVDEVVSHVEELILVGSGAEGGAHDEMHLHRGQHRPQRVELGPQLPVSPGVVRVQAGQQAVVRLLDGVMQEVVGGDDPPPLVVHVPPQFLEQGSEQNDSISQGILQLFD